MQPWSNILQSFEAELRGSGLAENTIASYLYDTRRFLSWLAEHGEQPVSPSTYSAEHLKTYRHHLRESLGQSRASVNRSMQSLRKFGQFAQVSGMRDSNPAQAIDLLPDAVVPVPRALTEEQIETLFRVTRRRISRTAARDLSILYLLLDTGMRVSELVALQVSDVDMQSEPGIVTVRAMGGRPQRSIPITATTREVLSDYLTQLRPAEAPHLFLGRGHHALSIRSVQQVVADLGRLAGLELSARALRSTHAALLWERGGDLSLLSERLGFRRLETALKYLAPVRGR